MGFANSIALLFFGLFIPVILLYLLKQRRRRVQVSTLLFWDRILRDEQTATSITKLEKLLSLLLQLLFITLLTLALARPLLSEKLTGARRIVLFLDHSASMAVKEGTRTRFDLAVEKAIDITRGLGMGDTLLLVAFAAKPDIVHPFTDSKRDLREAIRSVRLSHSESDFKAALQILDQLAPDPRETHVYLVTDGAFETVAWNPPPRTRFAYVKVGEQADNIGITAFQVRPLPASPRDFQIHVELTNQTEQDHNVPVELRINGRLVDAYEFPIPAGANLTRTLRQFSAQGGEIELVADFPDAFDLDNRAFATLPRPRPIRVRLVTENNLFLESALLTDDGVDLKILPPDQYVETEAYEVTIFSGWAPPRSPPGASIFVGAWPDDLGLPKLGLLEKPLFTDWDRQHPINQHLALKNVAIEKAIASRASTHFHVLAASFNDPLVLLRETTRTMVVTFDTFSTDLPLRVAFPIMIGNAIRFLAGAKDYDRWQNPPLGEILTRSELQPLLELADPDEKSALTRTILRPDGTRVALTNESSMLSLDYAGFYRSELTNGAHWPLFAANLSSQVESKIKPSPTLPIRSEPPLPELKETFRLGLEPWFYLVLAGFVLSAAEWVMFHRRVIE